MFFSNKKNKRLITILIFSLAFTVFVVGCTDGDDKGSSEAPDAEVNDTETDNTDNAKKTSSENKVYYANGDFEAIDDSNIIITSVGQSADISMLDAIIKKTDAEYTVDELADAEKIKEFDTVIIAAGASSKGLGAAGISAEDELKRAKEIIEVLEGDSKEVILAHIGGQTRRGTLSDQFIEVLLPIADYMIVVEEGNDDSMFTEYTSENNIPIAVVHNISDSLTPLQELFGKK